jgi:hypothetical protein
LKEIKNAMRSSGKNFASSFLWIGHRYVRHEPNEDWVESVMKGLLLKVTVQPPYPMWAEQLLLKDVYTKLDDKKRKNNRADAPSEPKNERKFARIGTKYS